MTSFPDSLNSKDEDGNTTLDLLVSNPAASIESIEFLANRVERDLLQQLVDRMDMVQYLKDRDRVVHALGKLASKIERNYKAKHGTNIAANSMDVVTGSAGLTAAIAVPTGLVASAPLVVPVAASVALGFGICSLVTRVSGMAVQHCDTKKIRGKIRDTNTAIQTLRIQDTLLNALFKRDYHRVQQIRVICDDLLRGIDVWDLPTVANLGFRVGKDYLTALDLVEVMLKRGTLAALFGGAVGAAGSAGASSALTSSSTGTSTTIGGSSGAGAAAAAKASSGAVLAASATGTISAFSALWALYNIPIDVDKLQNVPEIVLDLKKAATHAQRENTALKRWGQATTSSTRDFLVTPRPVLSRSTPFRVAALSMS